MSARKLDQYYGRLTAAQIAAGMNAASENAARLLADAVLLLREGRYPSAASLAVLAIEEAGKLAILRGMAMRTADDAWRKAWREYRSHRHKNTQSILPDLIAAGARSLDEMRAVTDPDSEHAALTEMLKQIGFYTDCLGKAHWSVPAAVIDRELAEQMVRRAEIVVGHRDHTFTEREIELWTQHMGPVVDKPFDWMKAALVNWHRAMISEGLAKTDPADVSAFVYGRRNTNAEDG